MTIDAALYRAGRRNIGGYARFTATDEQLAHAEFQQAVRNVERNYNTAIGANALQHTVGDNNIALGYLSGRNLTSGDNNIDIGNESVAGESSTVRIGSATQVRTFISGVSGSIVTGAIVRVNAAGQLGTAFSSQHLKRRSTE